MLTYDAENINRTNEVYNSLISCGKDAAKRTRGTGEQLYIDQNILRNCERKRKNVAMTWIDNKGMGYRPAKVDNRLSQNVQEIRRNHKVYRKIHEN